AGAPERRAPCTQPGRPHPGRTAPGLSRRVPPRPVKEGDQISPGEPVDMTRRAALPRSAALAVAVTLLGVMAMPRALAAAGGVCSHPVLVLTAMPLELNPLVAKATLDPSRRTDVAGKKFYGGRLAGNDAVLAMTGIGPANATHTAEAALGHFTCRFAAVVFSGVAGSQRNIGDVAVPARWTSDGKTWLAADPFMLRIASTLNSGNVKLSQD